MIKHEGKFVTIVIADEGKALVEKGKEDIKILKAIYAGKNVPEFEEIDCKMGE